MHKIINVNVKKPYEVVLCDGMLANIGEILKTKHKPCKAMIITDDIVADFYLEIVKKSLIANGFEVFEEILIHGEKNKTLTTYMKAINKTAENALTRDDLIIALGGGVVGDIAGFVAGTYMRGIDFVQIPTTLLSGIDASIGGKTGVDLPNGKNLAGCFHQPIMVFFDIDTLKTLPEIEFRNGLGEGIKYAVLKGGEILEILKDGIQNNLPRFCELCIKYKAKIVEQDEFESGKRKLLNLGHTFGHAIEQLSNFSVPHGVGVVKGIYIIAKASFNKGKLSNDDFWQLMDIINLYNFDITCDFGLSDLFNVIKSDKKMTFNNRIDFVDILGFGNCPITNLSLEEFAEYINEN